MQALLDHLTIHTAVLVRVNTEMTTLTCSESLYPRRLLSTTEMMPKGLHYLPIPSCPIHAHIFLEPANAHIRAHTAPRASTLPSEKDATSISSRPATASRSCVASSSLSSRIFVLFMFVSDVAKCRIAEIALVSTDREERERNCFDTSSQRLACAYNSSLFHATLTEISRRRTFIILISR